MDIGDMAIPNLILILYNSEGCISSLYLKQSTQQPLKVYFALQLIII